SLQFDLPGRIDPSESESSRFYTPQGLGSHCVTNGLQKSVEGRRQACMPDRQRTAEAPATTRTKEEGDASTPSTLGICCGTRALRRQCARRGFEIPGRRGQEISLAEPR